MSYHKVNHVQRCSTMLILEVAFSTLLDIIFPPKENNYFALYDITFFLLKSIFSIYLYY